MLRPEEMRPSRRAELDFGEGGLHFGPEGIGAIAFAAMFLLLAFLLRGAAERHGVGLDGFGGAVGAASEEDGSCCVGGRGGVRVDLVEGWEGDV